MKIYILFLLFIIVSICTHAQKLTKQNIAGIWHIKSLTAPSGLYYNFETDSLAFSEADLISLKEEGIKLDSTNISAMKKRYWLLKGIVFTFNNDGSYIYTIKNIKDNRTDISDIGKYIINGTQSLILSASKIYGGSKYERMPRKVKAYFKENCLLLHMPNEEDEMSVFELRKKK